MTGILALDICVALGILAGGAAVVWKAIAALHRVGNVADDLFGEPGRPGVPARPGVMERLSAIEDQLRPNHGTSLRDVADRLERGLRRVEDGLAEHLRAHQRSKEWRAYALAETARQGGETDRLPGDRGDRVEDEGARPATGGAGDRLPPHGGVA